MMGMKIKKFKRSSAFFMAAALCLGSTSGVYAMDESELSRIIEEAKNTDTSGYTPESCESLQAALEGAENLLSREDVTEEELGAGGMMLQAILENGLVAQADKSSLEAVLSEAAAYTDGTQDGYEVLDQVRAQAQAVLEDGNATQAETDGAASAVAQAEENLGGGIDKTVLSDLITQAEAVDTSGSDDASVQQLKSAIASAKQVAANPSATQSLVDKHIQLLQAAAEALYQKTDSNTVYDGVYQIGGLLHHATADQVSMGNSALVKPFQLIKKGNDIHLRIECTSLTTKLGKQNFTGYLASMWYFPGFTSEDTLPYAAAEEGQAVDTGETQNAAETEAEDQKEAQRRKQWKRVLRHRQRMQQKTNFLWTERKLPGTATVQRLEKRLLRLRKKHSLWMRMKFRRQRLPQQKQWVWNPTMTFMIPTTIRKKAPMPQ